MEAIAILAIPVVVSIGLLLLGFWIWMLVDCIKHESSEGHERIVWLLVIIFTKLIGAAIYYFVRRPQRMRLNASES